MVTGSSWPHDIALLVPAYRAEHSLRHLLPRLTAQVPRDQILVVDDGSGDRTAEVCREPGIPCIVHETNQGKGRALLTGFTRLLEQNMAAVITLDADGQHDPDDLQRFVADFRAHPEIGICIGRRAFRPGTMPFARIISNTLTSRILSWMCGVPILDSQCGYRLYTAAFLRAITIECPRFEMESEVILKAAHLGFPIRFVPVQTLYFKARSHIAHMTDTLRWIRASFGIWRFLKAARTTKPR